MDGKLERGAREWDEKMTVRQTFQKGGSSMSQEDAPSVYFQVAMERLEQQHARIEGIDNKLATVFGTSSIVLSIFAGFLGSRASDLSDVAVGLLVGGLAVYLLLGFFAYLGYNVREWSLRPNLQALKDNSRSYDEDAMRFWVGDECVESYDANICDLTMKASYLSLTIGLLAMQLPLLTGAALAAALG